MFIYKTTNLINNKIYIGQTTKDKTKSYLGSGTYFKKALKKYSKENFKREIMEHCSNMDELNEREIYWIRECNSQDKNIGYNLANGGTSQGKHSEETRKKISESNKGIKHSEETKRKISQATKGIERSEETRKKMSIAQKGRKLSEQHKNKLSESKKGKKLSKQHRKKISESQKGRVVSTETRKKISEAKKNTKPLSKL